MLDYEAVNRIRGQVAAGLSEEVRRRRRDGEVAFSRDEEQHLATTLVARVLEGDAAASLAAGQSPRPEAEHRVITESVDALLFGMGRLQRFLENPGIDNVVVHGAESVVIECADGRVTDEPSPWTSDEELEAEIRSLAARRGRTERRFDTAHPRLDLRLPDGTRLTAVMAVVHRPTLVLRRHRFLDLDMGDIEGLGTVDRPLRHFLEAAVAARLNVLVAGQTNVGKTTLLRALLSGCDPFEHIVTVETSLELGLQNLRHRHRHVTAMEAREANAEGEGQVTVADLVVWALRLNPDRMVVGEVLGDEVLAMLNALGNGANGFSTLHARSSHAVARRLASYAAQAPRPLSAERTAGLVADGIDLIVFLDKVPDESGRRRRVVTSVREVVGERNAELESLELFAPGPDGRAVATGVLPRRLFDLEAAGFDRRALDPEGALR